MLVPCREDDPALATRRGRTAAVWASASAFWAASAMAWATAGIAEGPPALVAARAAFVRSLMILRSRSASVAYRCRRNG
jgi:hypothetical protein